MVFDSFPLDTQSCKFQVNKLHSLSQILAWPSLLSFQQQEKSWTQVLSLSDLELLKLSFIFQVGSYSYDDNRMLFDVSTLGNDFCIIIYCDLVFSLLAL